MLDPLANMGDDPLAHMGDAFPKVKLTLPSNNIDSILNGKSDNSLVEIPMIDLNECPELKLIRSFNIPSKVFAMKVAQKTAFSAPRSLFPMLIYVHKGVVRDKANNLLEENYAIGFENTLQPSFKMPILSSLCSSIVVFLPYMCIKRFISWRRRIRDAVLAEQEKIRIEKGTWQILCRDLRASWPLIFENNPARFSPNQVQEICGELYSPQLLVFPSGVCIERNEEEQKEQKQIQSTAVEQQQSIPVIQNHKRKLVSEQEGKEEEKVHLLLSKNDDAVHSTLNLKNAFELPHKLKKPKFTSDRVQWRSDKLSLFDKDHPPVIGSSTVNLIYFYYHLKCPNCLEDFSGRLKGLPRTDSTTGGDVERMWWCHVCKCYGNYNIRGSGLFSNYILGALPVNVQSLTRADLFRNMVNMIKEVPTLTVTDEIAQFLVG